MVSTATPAIANSFSQVILTPESTSISQSTAGVSAMTPPKSLPMEGQPSQITMPNPISPAAATAATRFPAVR
jgi:hypothetical protein